MEQIVVKRRMYIPGLNQFNHLVVKALSRFYSTLIKYRLSVLPLPVGLVQAKAPVCGVVGVILILMKALLLHTVIYAQQKSCDKYQSEYIFFHFL